MASFYDAFEKPPPPPATVYQLRPAAADVEPYALAALQQEVERVATAANGSRNHTLNRATFSLAQLVAGGALTEQTVREHLTSAAQTCGLDLDEINATLNSGLRAGIQHPRGIPEREPFDTPPVTVLGGPIAEIVSVDIADKVRERLPLIDWHELWTRETTEEWIVEPLLPARRLVALYSAPKVGKSLLMLEIAVAVARGTQVLGTRTGRPRRVLYVDFENDPEGDVRERLQAMELEPGDLDNLCYLSFPTIAHLDTEAGSLELLAAAEVYECEVVVIDTVSRSVGGDENENDTWLNFYRHTGMKLKKAQKALIRLDHTGKDETKGQRGGSAKVGDVDAVWKMSKVNETTFRLDCEAHRFPLTEKTLVLHRETDPLRHRVDAYGARAAWDAKVEDCQAALDAAGAANSISNRDALELLRSTGTPTAKAVVEEAIRRRKLRLSTLSGPVDNSADSVDEPVDKVSPRSSGTPDEISLIDLSRGALRDRGL